MTCDPCGFCAHLCSGFSRIGDCAYGNDVMEYECDVDVEWAGPENGPCPSFVSILPSDGLYEQLYNEDLAREYAEESE